MQIYLNVSSFNHLKENLLYVLEQTKTSNYYSTEISKYAILKQCKRKHIDDQLTSRLTCSESLEVDVKLRGKPVAYAGPELAADWLLPLAEVLVVVLLTDDWAAVVVVVDASAEDRPAKPQLRLLRPALRLVRLPSPLDSSARADVTDGGWAEGNT